ncbi:hypothetical protein CTI14_71095, partial [Methylobacterium radiotolerans]
SDETARAMGRSAASITVTGSRARRDGGEFEPDEAGPDDHSDETARAMGRSAASITVTGSRARRDGGEFEPD